MHLRVPAGDTLILPYALAFAGADPGDNLTNTFLHIFIFLCDFSDHIIGKLYDRPFIKRSQLKYF